MNDTLRVLMVGDERVKHFGRLVDFGNRPRRDYRRMAVDVHYRVGANIRNLPQLLEDREYTNYDALFICLLHHDIVTKTGGDIVARKFHFIHAERLVFEYIKEIAPIADRYPELEIVFLGPQFPDFRKINRVANDASPEILNRAAFDTRYYRDAVFFFLSAWASRTNGAGLYYCSIEEALSDHGGLREDRERIGWLAIPMTDSNPYIPQIHSRVPSRWNTTDGVCLREETIRQVFRQIPRHVERARKMRRELVRSGMPRFRLDRPNDAESYLRWEARWPIFIFPEPSEREAGMELSEAEPFEDPLGRLPIINNNRPSPRCGDYPGTTQIPREEFLESSRAARQPSEKRQRRPFLIRHGDLDSGAGPSWPVTTRSPRREKVLTKKGPEIRHVFYDEAEGAHGTSHRTKWPLPETGPSAEVKTSLEWGARSHRTRTSELLRKTIPEKRPDSLHPDERRRNHAVFMRDKELTCLALEEVEIRGLEKPNFWEPVLEPK